MENKTNENNPNTRRKFLRDAGIVLGAGAMVTAGTLLIAKKAENSKIKKIKVLTPDGKVAEVDPSELKPMEITDKKQRLAVQQQRGWEGMPNRQWVMVIDLAKCRNARMCMAACQSAHHLYPEQHHINTYRIQDDPKSAPYFMPKNCFHCDNPPCTKVCPVNATWKRSDGIVLIDNERCIGCRFCMAACPYSARVFHWRQPKKVDGDENLVYDVELNVPQKKGTITKCLFSADRLREGKLPYCVSACPNGTYWFGDMNEDSVTNGTTGETTRFSELLKQNAGYTLMPELGTKPRVYYLPAKNRQFPFIYEEGTEMKEESKI